MINILSLGFSVIKFKKFPTVRVWIDDTLLDEFEVTTKNNFNRKHQGHIRWESDDLIFHPVTSSLLKSFKNMDKKTFYFENKTNKKFPILNDNLHLRFYEIDDKVLDKKFNLKIEIQGSNSNYTNGFMTKSTLLNFSICNILPKVFFTNLIDFVDKFEFSKYGKYNKKTFQKDIEIVKYYKRRRNLLDNFVYYSNWKGPDANSNNQKIWCGEKGIFSLDFIKKSKIFTAQKPIPIGYPRLGNFVLLCGLQDKYLEYENYRNHN